MADLRESPAGEEKKEAGIRATFLPLANQTVMYANAFQTNFAKNEIILTPCVSQQAQDKEGSMLAISPQQRIAINPEAAKRLAGALVQVIEEYEKNFGEITV